MAVVWQTIEERQPIAGILTDLWSVPTGNGLFKVKAVNLLPALCYIRIRVARAIAADTQEQAKAHDLPLTGNNIYDDTFSLVEGDTVRVQSSSGQVVFSIQGGLKS